MIQPKIEEITNLLKGVLNDEITREEVGKWALEFIVNDDTVKINDIKAWHYLITASSVDLMTAPDEYLYSIEDIKEWIKENSMESSGFQALTKNI